jgi:hypothetical protein
MDLSFEGDILLFVIIALVIIFFVLVIVLAWQRMKSSNRRMELDVEKEKLNIIQKDMAIRAQPFTRLSVEQLSSIRTLEDECEVLDIEVFTRQKVVENRIRRLESYTKLMKLERMIVKIDNEEKKVK